MDWNRNKILTSLNGSRLYGMATEDSDIDLMGVYVEDKRVVLTGRKHESISLAEPKANTAKRQAGEIDGVAYSARKFCNMARVGNPSLLNVLYSHGQYLLECTVEGRMILDNADLFVSVQAGERFHKYAESQLSRMKGVKLGHIPSRPDIIEKYGYDVKYASQVLRLVIQGVEFMETGTLAVPMREADAAYVKAMKTGAFTFQQSIGILEGEFRRLEAAIETSQLRPEPEHDKVDQLLIDIHESFWDRVQT